jgi:ABC-2 type transport system ATP-binding protein
MSSPAVSVNGVSKKFGANVVLNGVDLEIAPGEIFGMFGSNGCGKSTLLRILAGAMLPTSGTVAIHGVAGYVAQRFSLYQDLSVEENLWFYAQCYRPGDATLRADIDAVIERFGLAPFRGKRTGLLSHGWKQRVAIASALCHKPSVLLLDEVTAGIDPDAREDMWTILTDASRSGTAIILTTHFTDEARHCHRTGYLRDGLLGPGPKTGGGIG